MTTKAENQQPNRREFLYYLGGASVILLTGELLAGASRFLNPPVVNYGRGTGVFLLDLKHLPPESYPLYLPESLTYLANIEGELLALYSLCVYHSVGYIKWAATNNRFECPLCGSRFRKDGTYIRGLAPRDMDRFTLRVNTPQGILTTSSEGDAVSIENARSIELDVRQIIQGKPRA